MPLGGVTVTSAGSLSVTGLPMGSWPVTVAVLVKSAVTPVRVQE